MFDFPLCTTNYKKSSTLHFSTVLHTKVTGLSDSTMEQIYCHITLLCLLFGAVYSCTEEQTDMAATYTTDARWRIASGFDLSRVYTIYSVS